MTPCQSTRPDLERGFEAMATPVRFRVVGPGAGADAALARAEAIVHEVHPTCTRFDPTSPLMQANAAGAAWHPVPWTCLEAIAAAGCAHLATAGRFDPRVLTVLTGWGYCSSLPFSAGAVRTEAAGGPRPGPTAPWTPGIDRARGLVRIGAHPVDLGGIGKGLALRWAAAQLRAAGRAALLEAGGDCVLLGAGPDDTGWAVAVEDPAGGADPIAVLSLRDTACATSSVRVRRWRAGDAEVHHLVDPRTALPGGGGLQAVTVVHPDPAWAEVWAKTLFLAGPTAIATQAERHGLAALWTDADGGLDLSPALRPHLQWVGRGLRADR
jgi:thiamine biosynthesis lipoprotein